MRLSNVSLRVLLATVVVVSMATVGFGFAKWTVFGSASDALGSGERPAPPADGVTVVTTSMHGNNFVVAYAPDGSVLYYNDTLDVYNDVDPSPEGDLTVTYVGATVLDRRACPATEACNLNVVERVNLSTGEVERRYSRVTARSRDSWHDVDRLDADRWLIADIALDRVFVVDATTGLIEWEWDVQSEYDLAGGGLFPGDWTHLNDADRLPDGRVMVSLRNQDQIVFVDPEAGLQEDWTLGTDDDREVLFEQHNPDYLPPERGGPAVLVADSEANRIVEYQREGDEWRRTWRWADARLRWPRDADRLPNGHTLITDTNGGRVIEVDESGEVVWTVDVIGPYDAERLDTGPGSAGGRAASVLGLESRTAASRPARELSGTERVVQRAVAAWTAALPSRVVNSLLYVLPPWIGVVELGGIAAFAAAAAAWGAAEFRWSGWRLRSPVARGPKRRVPATNGSDRQSPVAVERRWRPVAAGVVVAFASAVAVAAIVGAFDPYLGVRAARPDGLPVPIFDALLLGVGALPGAAVAGYPWPRRPLRAAAGAAAVLGAFVVPAAIITGAMLALRPELAARIVSSTSLAKFGAAAGVLVALGVAGALVGVAGREVRSPRR